MQIINILISTMLIWPAEIQLYDPENRLYKVENSKEGNRSIINAKFYIIHTLAVNVFHLRSAMPRHQPIKDCSVHP
jgi:hypothetical protein